MLFLDPDKPITTCISNTCDGCPAGKNVHCHFSLQDLLHFCLLAFPSLLIGGAGVLNGSGWWLLLWLIAVIGYFGFIEIRVMCSHCPHYAETGKSLKCWANYASPKIWQYRPGPMVFWEKFVFFLGLALIWATPLYFLISGIQLFLLFMYLLTSAGFLMTLKRFFCSQCMNFACPLNGVGEGKRKLFFACNPEVARAWGQNIDTPRENTI